MIGLVFVSWICLKDISNRPFSTNLIGFYFGYFFNSNQWIIFKYPKIVLIKISYMMRIEISSRWIHPSAIVHMNFRVYFSIQTWSHLSPLPNDIVITRCSFLFYFWLSISFPFVVTNRFVKPSKADGKKSFCFEVLHVDYTITHWRSRNTCSILPSKAFSKYVHVTCNHQTDCGAEYTKTQ